jgi:hypothetical protein
MKEVTKGKASISIANFPSGSRSRYFRRRATSDLHERTHTEGLGDKVTHKAAQDIAAIICSLSFHYSTVSNKRLFITFHFLAVTYNTRKRTNNCSHTENVFTKLVHKFSIYQRTKEMPMFHLAIVKLNILFFAVM